MFVKYRKSAISSKAGPPIGIAAAARLVVTARSQLVSNAVARTPACLEVVTEGTTEVVGMEETAEAVVTAETIEVVVTAETIAEAGMETTAEVVIIEEALTAVELEADGRQTGTVMDAEQKDALDRSQRVSDAAPPILAVLAAAEVVTAIEEEIGIAGEMIAEAGGILSLIHI